MFAPPKSRQEKGAGVSADAKKAGAPAEAGKLQTPSVEPLLEMAARAAGYGLAGTPASPGEDGSGSAPALDPAGLHARLGRGLPLDGGVRGRMEPAFKQDFSRVRVHSGGAATALSSEVRARAFTLQEDVVFGAGEYSPGTPVGDAILAHELAHVVQQRRGATGPAGLGSAPSTSSWCPTRCSIRGPTPSGASPRSGLRSARQAPCRRVRATRS